MIDAALLLIINRSHAAEPLCLNVSPGEVLGVFLMGRVGDQEGGLYVFFEVVRCAVCALEVCVEGVRCSCGGRFVS